MTRARQLLWLLLAFVLLVTSCTSSIRSPAGAADRSGAVRSRGLVESDGRRLPTHVTAKGRQAEVGPHSVLSRQHLLLNVVPAVLVAEVDRPEAIVRPPSPLSAWSRLVVRIRSCRSAAVSAGTWSCLSAARYGPHSFAGPRPTSLWFQGSLAQARPCASPAARYPAAATLRTVSGSGVGVGCSAADADGAGSPELGAAWTGARRPRPGPPGCLQATTAGWGSSCRRPRAGTRRRA